MDSSESFVEQAKQYIGKPYQFQPIVGAPGGLLDTANEVAAALQAVWDATPEERAEWAAEAKADRAVEREAAERVPLTLEALGESRGWSREYMEHLIQPYCGCRDGSDGWERCEHARDLGLDEA